MASQACAGCFGEAREGIARWKRQEGRERRVEKKERTSFFSLSLSSSPSPLFPFSPLCLFVASGEQALEVAALRVTHGYMLMPGHDE